MSNSVSTSPQSLRDLIPQPMLSMIDDLLDIENLPGFRLQDRLPPLLHNFNAVFLGLQMHLRNVFSIPDVDIDPMDFFLVPPPSLPCVPEFDRDLSGRITEVFEHYSAADEVAGMMAALHFGQAPICDCVQPTSDVIDASVNWQTVKCEMQQFSDAVICGTHWAEEDKLENDIQSAPSFETPSKQSAECLYLSQNQVIRADDPLSQGDKDLIKVLMNECEGDYVNSAFFINSLNQGDDTELLDEISKLKCASRTDPLLPNDIVSRLRKVSDATAEAERRNSQELDAFSICKNSFERRKKSFNEWKSISRSFNPADFEAIRANLIMEWPFELDDFQKQAIVELEKDNSVFVSAHTSAGKTVVAEYAIALSRAHGTRCVYCSPIKALSNQKYREFKSKFDEVGLVTGDIQLKPEAFFVIMTTEILRTMVYNSSALIYELEWLIFDEVHYVNDVERGVVWEEILILIPPHVKFVMLSATVPNAVEFADWVGHTKRRQVHVISTLERPVTLQHYVYLPSGDMFLVRSGEGQFIQKSYKHAVDCYHDRYRVRSSNKRRNTWITLIQHMRNFQLMPLIIFVFSRSLCDEMADLIASQDLLSSSEQSKVRKCMDHALSLLDEQDRSLEQVVFVTELTLHGVGVHHSGLLTILKEYVEILFTSGLIKVLLATETFAMGVNMPARTVVFCKMRKFDGICRRFLHAELVVTSLVLSQGEYTQMSGRAGRRGIDTSGVAIIVCEDTPPSAQEISAMIQGAPLTLLSKFRLTFAICLKILRTTGFSMLKMLRNSFSEFSGVKQSLVAAHDYEETERLLNHENSNPQPFRSCQTCAAHINEYARDCIAYWSTKAKTDCVLWNTFCTCPYNHPGRLVYLQANYHYSMVPAILVEQGHPAQRYVHVVIPAYEWTAEDECPQVDPRKERIGQGQSPNSHSTDTTSNTQAVPQQPMVSSEYISWLAEYAKCDMIFFSPLKVRDRAVALNFGQTRGRCNLKFVNVVFAQIPTMRLQAFSKCVLPGINLNYVQYHHPGMNQFPWRRMHDGSYIRQPHDNEEFAFRCTAFFTRPEIFRWSANMFLEIKNDIGIRDHENFQEQTKLNLLLAKQIQSPIVECQSLVEHLSQYLKIVCLEERIHGLRAEMSDERLELFDEYKKRLKFLESLGFLETGDRISLTQKGHAACLVNEHEVVIVELLCSRMMLRGCGPEPDSQTLTSAEGSSLSLEDKNLLGPHPLASLAAMLSTLVCTARDVGNEISPASELENEAKPAMNRFLQLIRELDEKLSEHDLSRYKIMPCLNNTFTQLVYRWARGDSFKSCMNLTQQQEGIVVKCIQRINDICKELQRAARYFTLLEIVEHLEELKKKLQRGVVHTLSIYSEE